MTRTDTDEPAGGGRALADLLCFDLYSASRAITGVYRHVLEPLHLTYPQYLVLTVLWHRGSATVGEIIEDVQLDYGTVSPLLKRLETRGLVERRRRVDDERSVDITLTDDGRALQDQARGLPAVIGTAFGLDRGDVAELGRLLSSVRASAAEQSARLAGSSAARVG